MRGDAAESNGGAGGELTTRCRLERCVSGMKRTGRVMWSSRVWKKVNSLPMELLTTDLLAAKNKVESEEIHVRKSGSGGRRPSPPLTGRVVLPPPLAPLPLLVAHLPLGTLRTSDRTVTTRTSVVSCMSRMFACLSVLFC